MKDSISIYDPLREQLEIYVSPSKLTRDQKDSLLNSYVEEIPAFADFKAILRFKPESIKMFQRPYIETLTTMFWERNLSKKSLHLN